MKGIRVGFVPGVGQGLLVDDDDSSCDYHGRQKTGV